MSKSGVSYDWSTLAQFKSVGVRDQDEDVLTPMTWPDYKDWHMSKDCPSYLRLLVSLIQLTAAFLNFQKAF